MQDTARTEPTFTTRETLKSTTSLDEQKDLTFGPFSSQSSSASSSSSILDVFAEAAATISLSPASSSPPEYDDDCESGDEEEDECEYDDEDNDPESEARTRTSPSSLKSTTQNKFAPGQIQASGSGSSLPLKLAPKVTPLSHKASDVGDASEAFKRSIEKRRYTKRGRRRKLDPEVTNLLSSFLREKTAAGVLYTQADVITFVKDITRGDVVLSNVDVTRYTQRLGFNRRDKPRPAPSSLPPPVPIGPPIAPRVSPRVPLPSSVPVPVPAPQKTNQRTTRSSATAASTPLPSSVTQGSGSGSGSGSSSSVQSPSGTASHRASRHSQPPQRSLSSTSPEIPSERRHASTVVSPPSQHMHPGYFPDVADPLAYAAQQQQLQAYQDYQAHQYMQMMYQHMLHQQMQEMERFQQQQQEQMQLAAQRMVESRHSQPVPSFPNRHCPTPEALAPYPEQRGAYAEPRASERVETAVPVVERPSWKPQKKSSHRLPGHLPSASSLPMAPVSVKRASNSQPPLPSVRHLLDALAPHVSFC